MKNVEIKMFHFLGFGRKVLKFEIPFNGKCQIEREGKTLITADRVLLLDTKIGETIRIEPYI